MLVLENNNDVYTQDFYFHHRPGMEAAAGVIAPIIQKLVPAQSLVDVGCGQGAWLAEFWRLGVEKILGIDGDHVQQDSLLIPKNLFLAADLSDPDKLLELNVGSFDLAVCLEVAEHLPASSAEAFVKFLTGLAPVVLFSAAVPGQGGTNHVNEQFLSYWVRLFSQFNYRPLDIVRPIVWNDDRVPFWYRQNIILFANDSDETWSELFKKVTTGSDMDYLKLLFSSPLDAIHPELFKKDR